MDHEGAVREARELYDAGEGRRGTDEDKFTEIIGTRSFAQLRATFEEYTKVWRGCGQGIGVWSRAASLYNISMYRTSLCVGDMVRDGIVMEGEWCYDSYCGNPLVTIHGHIMLFDKAMFISAPATPIKI